MLLSRNKCAAIVAALALGSVYAESVLGIDLTVRDSIELTTFSDPSTRNPLAQTKSSPDGTHVAVVTTRGLLASNEIESTLWVFDVLQVKRYVRSDDGMQAPEPRRIAKFVGIPRAAQVDSYGSLITRFQWSTDSGSILFLGENTDGRRQLYRADIAQETARPLTEMSKDIERFNANADTVIYADRAVGSTDRPIGTPINSTATAVTGLPMPSILFSTDSRVSSALQLGVIRYGRSVTVAESGASEGLRLSAMSRLEPTISPDGHAVIVARPVTDIPSSWEAYQTTMPSYLRFQTRAGDPETRSGTRGFWPWQYVLIDLERPVVHPLVDAPGGMVGGYSDSEKAVWSPSGNVVLLTNTYLPLEGVDPQSVRADWKPAPLR